jgi:hypothetical protein
MHLVHSRTVVFWGVDVAGRCIECPRAATASAPLRFSGRQRTVMSHLYGRAGGAYPTINVQVPRAEPVIVRMHA